MMKILLVIHTPKDEKTAVCKVYLERKALLEKEGHEVALLGPEDFPGLGKFRQYAQIFYPFAVAIRILQKKQGYDCIVFHSYSGWVFHVLKPLIAGLKKIQTITEFHGLEPLFIKELIQEHEASGKALSLRFRIYHGSLLNKLIRFSARRSNRVLCLNAREKNYLIEHQYQKEENVCVVQNSVKLHFFRNKDYAEHVTKLLYVGHWLMTKGTRYLVEAFSDLVKKYPDLTLMLVGTRKSEEVVLQDFPEKIRDHVQVYPSVEHEQMNKFYQEADIFVFPSLSEGSSCAVIEAMASGLPIVSTNVGYAAEFFKAGHNAMVVDSRSSDAIVSAVQLLMEDASMRRLMGAAAQECARKFEQDANSGIWKEAYTNYAA